MSDDIIPINNNANLPDHVRRTQDLLAGIANIANSIADAGGVASGLPFIGINGDGKWAFGQERTEVEPGSLWAVDLRTLQHGYIAWPDQKSKDRKPLAERMYPANVTKPLVTTLPDVGVPYQNQYGVEMFCVSGEDTGTLAQYKNGSDGAKRMINTLGDDVRKQARYDQVKLCPVVNLEIDSYFHPEWRKTIYKPLLTIRKWISYEDFDALIARDEAGAGDIVGETAEVAAPEPEPAPAPRPRAAARGNGRPAPAPEPVAAAPAAAPTPTPARRRRPQAAV